MNTKHIIIALGVSVLLNAFLGGFVLSHHAGKHTSPFMHDSKDHRPPPPMENMMFHVVKSQSKKLSADGQKTVVKIADKYQTSLKENDMEKMEDIFADIRKTMTADVFDKKKVENLHKQLNSTEMRVKNAIGDMMIDIASHLSKEDRISFFTDLFPPPPPQGKWDGPPPPPDFFEEKDRF